MKHETECEALRPHLAERCKISPPFASPSLPHPLHTFQGSVLEKVSFIMTLAAEMYLRIMHELLM